MNKNWHKTHLNIKFSFLIGIWGGFSCGSPVLQEIRSFLPNQTPALSKIEVRDSNQSIVLLQEGEALTTQLKPEISPNQLFYLTLEINDPEINPIKISYSAISIYNPNPNTSNSDTSYICSSDPHNSTFNQVDIGTFNKKLQTDDFAESITATTTFFLPATLPVQSDIYIKTIMTDSKLAEKTQYVCLGPVKKEPKITNLTSTAVTDSSDVIWKANTNASFIMYTKGVGVCSIDFTSSPILFDYVKDTVEQRVTPVIAKPFCIVLFDELGQFEALTYE